MAALLRNKFAVPLGLLLAFVAAVGVWFIPINPAKSVGGSGSGGGASWQQRISASRTNTPATLTPASQWAQPKPEGLAELTTVLDKLREAPPESPVLAQDDAEETDDTTSGAAPEPEVTLDWEYHGFIGTSETRAAMLLIAGRQRFHFEGDLVRDPDDPEGEPVKIASISPVMVVAETKGVKVKFLLSSLSAEQRAEVLVDADASAASPARAITPPRPATADEIRRRQAAAAAARGQAGRTASPNSKNAPPVQRPATPPAQNQPRREN